MFVFAIFVNFYTPCLVIAAKSASRSDNIKVDDFFGVSNIRYINWAGSILRILQLDNANKKRC